MNWIRLNLRSRTCGERSDEQRLGQPGHADDEAVAADEERQQDLVDDLSLSNDQLRQLGLDALPAGIHPIGQRNVLRRIHHDAFFLSLLDVESHDESFRVRFDFVGRSKADDTRLGAVAAVGTPSPRLLTW